MRVGSLEIRWACTAFLEALRDTGRKKNKFSLPPLDNTKIFPTYIESFLDSVLEKNKRV
jgi:hypothetical protein